MRTVNTPFAVLRSSEKYFNSFAQAWWEGAANVVGRVPWLLGIREYYLSADNGRRNNGQQFFRCKISTEKRLETCLQWLNREYKSRPFRLISRLIFFAIDLSTARIAVRFASFYYSLLREVPQRKIVNTGTNLTSCILFDFAGRRS